MLPKDKLWNKIQRTEINLDICSHLKRMWTEAARLSNRFELTHSINTQRISQHIWNKWPGVYMLVAYYSNWLSLQTHRAFVTEGERLYLGDYTIGISMAHCIRIKRSWMTINFSIKLHVQWICRNAMVNGRQYHEKSTCLNRFHIHCGLSHLDASSNEH